MLGGLFYFDKVLINSTDKKFVDGKKCLSLNVDCKRTIANKNNNEKN